MEKISAAIIAYNEEKNIRRCLESVSWADEIVVIDSFSTDRTVEICREYTDRVIQHEWEGHIRQKNFAVESAANDWIFSIDSDEEVSPELRDSILALRERGLEQDGYRMARRTHYLGRWIRHSGWYPDYKVRLFQREWGRWGGVDPHDEVQLEGTCETLEGDLHHYSYEDVAAHVRELDFLTTISSQELYKMGRKASVVNLLLSPAGKFLKTLFLKGGLLDGWAGFFIAVTGSFYVFLKYLKLWELHHVKRPDPGELRPPRR